MTLLNFVPVFSLTASLKILIKDKEYRKISSIFIIIFSFISFIIYIILGIFNYKECFKILIKLKNNYIIHWYFDVKHLFFIINSIFQFLNIILILFIFIPILSLKI